MGCLRVQIFLMLTSLSTVLDSWEMVLRFYFWKDRWSAFYLLYINLFNIAIDSYLVVIKAFPNNCLSIQFNRQLTGVLSAEWNNLHTQLSSCHHGPSVWFSFMVMVICNSIFCTFLLPVAWVRRNCEYWGPIRSPFESGHGYKNWTEFCFFHMNSVETEQALSLLQYGAIKYF